MIRGCNNINGWLSILREGIWNSLPVVYAGAVPGTTMRAVMSSISGKLSAKLQRLSALAMLMLAEAISADSSGPSLAGYYDDFMAICNGNAYEWSDTDEPRKSITGVTQVGVGRNNRYGLTLDGRLLAWRSDPAQTELMMDGVKSFHAGRSGLLVILNDDSLWLLQTKSLFGLGETLSAEPTPVATAVRSAAVGDSANYYITRDGDLFVKGLAHRGQYGDGKLTTSETWQHTFSKAVQVSAHTGHALLLKQNGGVWGTGGNIYGPLGHHGYGDKAINWGLILDGVKAIATGSSHSLAIKADNSLWIWGRNEGLEPRRVMSGVTAVAAGNSATVALGRGYLWQWETGEQPRRIIQCE
ncbi:MAG: alpha-tubulin suppressor-like RCC1 family protein [Planctomycetota bacterium]